MGREQLRALELLLALGLAGSYVGLVSSIVLEALESGALASAANAATFSGFMHFIRLFGGQVGTSVMNRNRHRARAVSRQRSGPACSGRQLVDGRTPASVERGLFSPSSGADEAQSRAIGILSQQVRGQAYTMAISDGFVVICWMVVVYLLLLLFLRRAKFSYQDLRKL
jgi:MFS transporter, DHA2 family, multidrug resistance protein